MGVIHVDADACPVRVEAERVATRHGMLLFLVSDGGLRPSRNSLVKTVFVPGGPDAADEWIAGRAGPGDVVVTADIPLAARCLGAGARVLRPDGTALARNNMGNALAMRDLMAGLRAADPFRRGSGRAFSKADRARFLDALEGAVRKAMREAPDDG